MRRHNNIQTRIQREARQYVALIKNTVKLCGAGFFSRQLMASTVPGLDGEEKKIIVLKDLLRDYRQDMTAEEITRIEDYLAKAGASQ